MARKPVRVVCSCCDGKGRIPGPAKACTRCNGNGWIKTFLGEKACPRCDGEGQVHDFETCSHCQGDGYVIMMIKCCPICGKKEFDCQCQPASAACSRQKAVAQTA